MERSHGEGGFTLVEMLVVITIIGLVMGLIGPRVLNSLGEAKVKTAKLQIESFGCTAGWASAVTITILPSLAISTRAMSTPAAVTALTALVTSCCRNVEGARAMVATEKPACRSMLRARRAPTVPRIRLSQSGPPVRLDAGAQAHKLGWRRV